MPHLHRFLKDNKKIDVRQLRKDLVKELPRFSGLNILDKFTQYKAVSDVEMPINELKYYLIVKETQKIPKFKIKNKIL